MEKTCSIDFLRDTRGAVLPIFGLMVILLVVIGGSAIDVSRAVNAREKLSYAIDAAALSVATNLSTSVMTDQEITDAIEDSFRANLANADFLDKAIENLNFVVDSDEGTVTISSSASLSTYFLDIGGYGLESFGPDAFSFGTQAQVAYSRFDVELALVVDVTGSMGSHMNALRDAAEAVVDILIPAGTDPDDSKVRISLVPYSQGVNLGTYASTVTNGGSTSADCVNERDGAQKYTDAVYNYDGSTSEFFHGRPDHFVWDDDGDEDWDDGEDSCPSSELHPLTSDREALIDEVQALDDGGGTGGQTGIAWGWYTISPSWASLWPAASEPAEYPDGIDDEVMKFALIMTDGNFNAEYSMEEVTTCTGKKKKKTCTTSDEWVERYHENSDYGDPPAVRARELCDAMKDSGIELYSVYFDTGGSGFGDDLMSYCASGTDNYYEADSSSNLIQAFSNIAKKIQQIYLAK